MFVYNNARRLRNRDRYRPSNKKKQSNKNKLTPFPIINYKRVQKGIEKLASSKSFHELNSLYTKQANKFVKQKFEEKDIDKYFQDLKNIINNLFDNKQNLYQIIWFIQFKSLFSDNYRFDLKRLHQAFPTIGNFMKIWSHSSRTHEQQTRYIYNQHGPHKNKNKNKNKNNNIKYGTVHHVKHGDSHPTNRVHRPHRVQHVPHHRLRRSMRAKPIATMNQAWNKLYLSPKYYYFDKTTSYYYSPHTAYIFAFEFALPYGTKFIWNIRDPVKRIWSLKQHWYRPEGRDSDHNGRKTLRGKKENQMQGESAQIDLLKHYFGDEDDFELGIGIEWVRFLIGMSFIENENVLSNRDMAVIYLNFYYGTYAKYVSQSFIASMYCYHLSFWLEYFDAAFNSSSYSDSYSDSSNKNVTINVTQPRHRTSEKHFKIWQTSFIVSDLSKSINLIYCWLKYDISNYNKDWKRCQSVLKATGEYQTNLYDKSASHHQWNWPMDDKNKKFWANLFKPCNSRLDNIVAKRPNLVLGQWNSWNTKYFAN